MFPPRSVCGQRVLNQFLKGREPPRPGHEAPVDEKRGRAADPQLGALGQILADRSRLLAAVQTGVETRRIELQVGRVLFELGYLQGLGVRNSTSW